MYEQNDSFATGYAVGRDANNGYGNGYGFGGDWASWIILFLIFGMFGWGGNGFGFGGFGGGAMNGALTRGELCQDMNFNDLQSGVRGLSQGICDSTFALNNTITNGFAGVQQTLCQGFSGINTGLMQQGYETRLGVNALSNQLQQCCCDLRAGQADIKYTMAKDTCDITNAISGSTQQILGFLTQEKISSLQAENQALKFAASQSAQNAFITANQEAQTAELIRRLGRDCPIPAYVVPNPNCCYPQNNQCGCGCGC